MSGILVQLNDGAEKGRKKGVLMCFPSCVSVNIHRGADDKPREKGGWEPGVVGNTKRTGKNATHQPKKRGKE